MGYQSSLLPLYRRRRAVGGFSPLSLFASGEQGGWYDPSDLTTLFQDAAGTTAAALESPVGLVLDKSKGLVLGSELVTNGDFSSATGWVLDATATISGGTLNINNSWSIISAAQTFAIVAGRTYEFRATCTSFTSGSVVLQTKTGAVVGAFVINGTGTYRAFVVAGAANDGIRLLTQGGGFVGSIDNISVRELPGNHLSQSTSTARPVLSARVNLLTRTEEFSNAVWQTAGSVTKGTTTGTRPNGTSGTIDTVTFGSLSSGTAFIYQDTGQTWLNSAVKFAVYARVASGTATVYLNIEDIAAAPSGGNFIAGSAITLTSEWQLVSLTGTRTAATGNAVAAIGFDTRAAAGQTNASSLTIQVWGADLRPSNAGVGLPSYQRVGAATYGVTNPSVVAGTADYDATGFPYYLKFDGTDDFLVSGTDHPFTYTGAISVFAGFRKTGSTKQYETLFACGVVGNSTTNGKKAMGFQVTDDGNNRLATDIWHPAGVRGSTTLTSPVNGVAIFNIANWSTHRSSGATVTLNGVAETVATYGTADPTGLNTSKMYVGVFDPAPGVLASSFFTGNLYGLIARGAQSTAGEITSASTWLNGKTRAY